MGNYRFKLSDMIPNAWFYKLKDMGRPRNTHLSKERTQQPPSKSKQQQQPHDLNPRNSYYISRELVPVDGLYPPSTVISSSVSTGCSCRETVWKNRRDARGRTPSDRNETAKFNHLIKDIKKKHNNKDRNTCPVKKSSVSSSGVRLRTHSPRIGNRRLNQGHGRNLIQLSLYLIKTYLG
ncbi:uncharacterized protein LOC120128328 [Hibiscus syriacus]|uniref:uncharacterized protein LOC120128328 n=1 Tax=Hibiscus syriacus TaxID=106335 RepID=UPI001921A4A9|nr:uncharacterized protein LOC120128328 [Hibiscus syriacus]